jgi:aliphatic nitrilase
MSSGKFLAAAVQAEPIWFDLDRTIEKTDVLAAQAAARGASLIAFPEVWLPGYPVFIWMENEAWQAPHREKYIEQSMELGSPAHRRLEQIARDRKIALVVGFSERAHGRIYMAQLLIDAQGNTKMTRRKLKPSGLEGTFYSTGTPADLKVVDTEVGRVGALNCSEHRRPMLRHTLYCQGEQLHVASWPAFGLMPDGATVQGLFRRFDNWPQYGVLPDVASMEPQACMTTTRAYAREGGLFVLAPTMLIGKAFREDFSELERVRAQLNVGGGSTHIFDPFGHDAVPPLAPGEEGMLVAEIDYSKLRKVHDADPLFAAVSPADYQKGALAAGA